MNTANPFGKQYQKYWNRLPQKFTKFNKGIQIDLEGLYSTGPEEVSKKIARRTAASTVVDGFCGVGGSTIGFAYYAEKVYAIDNNPDRLRMAIHNVNLYGFSEKVEFILGDFLRIAPTIEADAVFLDPPWGGPDYIHLQKFRFENFSTNGMDLLRTSFGNFRKVVMRLPKNFDMSQLSTIDFPYVVEDETFEGRLIFKTLYITTALECKP